MPAARIRFRRAAVAGTPLVRDRGAGRPPAWLYYVNTGDVDAMVAKATRRGGKVLNGPVDIPGGGRIAQLADPQGAAFALHQGP